MQRCTGTQCKNKFVIYWRRRLNEQFTTEQAMDYSQTVQQEHCWTRLHYFVIHFFPSLEFDLYHWFSAITDTGKHANITTLQNSGTRLKPAVFLKWNYDSYWFHANTTINSIDKRSKNQKKKNNKQASKNINSNIVNRKRQLKYISLTANWEKLKEEEEIKW